MVDLINIGINMCEKCDNIPDDALQEAKKIIEVQATRAIEGWGQDTHSFERLIAVRLNMFRNRQN